MARGNPNIAEAGKSTRFSSDNQPKKSGRKGKSTTEYLRELGEANAIDFNITITDKDGKKKTKKGKVESQSSLNELLAGLLFADAINGNHKARKEILDRLEGRPKQSIDHTTDGQSMNLSPEERTRRIAELKSKMKDDK